MEAEYSSTMLPNKQVLFKNYVEGYPKESDFELRSTMISSQIPQGSKGLFVKNLYLGCDPYMRHKMSLHESKDVSLLTSFKPGSVITGLGVSKVIKSANADFEEGDYIWGMTGWEDYSLILNPDGLFKIKYTDVPLSYYAGILGMPGLAAYIGFYNVCSAKEGDIVYVSSAAGGVGQLVGQFAKMKGCYVVGSASTDEKVNLLKSELGFDDAFNYKEGDDFAGALKRHFPKGIDVYFENVGGNMLDEVLLHMNLYGRITVSGMISQYNLKKPDGIHNLFCLITKRLRMEGFSELDFRHKVPEYLEFVIQLIREKKLVFVEDIAEGLENAASAFVGIYHGRNVGKQIIQVSTD
ncbi:PREDICTED: 2-alkenal reductase (NADP(+)-dependent)-like [Nicotiana attenuata]|uniref:2-alkenal reductase (Nadp(+)-dependent) n=1 Tax=Nicotiana attenuata TaxID=49451 RepID=A0A1J6K139_NICAT|nr:PREDICTED: 2-alkenal reductase (NADP(+)-dependent)-like [Nicotiana attenuata]OIT23038.1 2-alkenal reductase (nadp(+)-dependent) [Nicotiana attenuata]